MSDWLLLRLPRTAEQAATWLVADARGTPTGLPHGGPLSLAVPRATGRRLCVLVPGADVLLTEPDVPAKGGAKLQQLVPFALEEHLADDIDDLHFAIGRRAGDSLRTPVAVVARALLDEWLTTLRTAGLEPEVVYADSDLLPHNPGQSVALLEEDAVSVRPPGGSPVTLPADALAEALEIAQSGADASAGARGLILYTGAAEWQRHSAQVEAARPRFDGIKVQLLTGGPLALFAQQLPGTSAINLLQGSYTTTSTRAIGFKAWRVAAMLLAGLVGAARGRQDHRAAAAEEARASGGCLDPRHLPQAMPGEVSAARCAPSHGAAAGRRARRRRGTAAGAAGTRAGARQRARHQRAGAEFSLRLARDEAARHPMPASLDRLSQSLRSNGWQADLTGGTNQGSGYEGRIQVRANGS